MNISKKDNTTLLKIFDQVNEIDYIECVFLIRKKIYFDKLINLLNIIKNQTQREYEETEILDISLKDNNIRTSIIGKENIDIYCKLNDIDKVEDEYKVETFKMKAKNVSKYLFDYDSDISVNSKIELEKDKETNSYNIYDNDLLDIINQNSDKIVSKKFNRNIKTFRHKKRYSILDKNNIFRYDITIVKTSQGRSIYNSNLFSKRENYEIEIEYVNKVDDYNIFLKNIISNITLVLRSLVDSYLICNSVEQEIVKEVYIEYVKKMYRDSLNDKLKIKNKENININKQKLEIHNLTLKGIKKTDIEKEIKRLEKRDNKDFFLNPKPVTISMDNIRDDGKINILEKYTVTDKADGDSMLLYVLGINHLDKKLKTKYKKY